MLSNVDVLSRDEVDMRSTINMMLNVDVCVVIRLSMGHKAHYVGNMVMLAAAVAAIFTASGAVWGLDKTDSGLTNIEDHTQDIATDLQSVSQTLALANTGCEVMVKCAGVMYW